MTAPRRLLVDASYLAYQAWYSVHKPGSGVGEGDDAQDSELGAYARRMALDTATLVRRFPDRQLIFCMDPEGLEPLHRALRYAAHYVDQHWAYMVEEPDQEPWLAITWDRKWYRVHGARLEGAAWEVPRLPDRSSPLQKLKKAEIPAEGDMSPANVEHDSLYRILPRYKQGHSSWPFAIPKSAWRTLTAQLVRNLAATAGGHALAVSGYEADDLAWALAQGSPDVVALTGDRDWRQLGMVTRLRMMDTPEGELAEWLPDAAWEDLAAKVIGGDLGDNIAAAIPLKGKTNGPGTAAKLAAGRRADSGQFWREAETLFWGPSLERNLELIYLGASGEPCPLPPLVQEPARWGWEGYGVRPAEMARMEMMVRAQK